MLMPISQTRAVRSQDAEMVKLNEMLTQAGLRSIDFMVREYLIKTSNELKKEQFKNSLKFKLFFNNKQGYTIIEQLW